MKRLCLLCLLMIVAAASTFAHATTAFSIPAPSPTLQFDIDSNQELQR